MAILEYSAPSVSVKEEGLVGWDFAFVEENVETLGSFRVGGGYENQFFLERFEKNKIHSNIQLK